MSNNSKILQLLSRGFSINTLNHLNENDINRLHKKLFTEQESEVDDLNNKVTNLRQNIASLKNDMEELGEEDVGPSSDDGMKDYQDGMVEEETDNPYAICTSSLDLVGRKRDSYTKDEEKKFERCVLDVKKESVRKLEESLVSLILQTEGMITKKDLIEQEVAPTRVKPGTKEKPKRGTPYKPKHSPKPKAGNTETAPTRVKPGTKEKPKRGTPYKPKHSPKPKAEDKSIPDFFKFDNINITFKDE
jgi:uncharacterized coiled-coil protein SlyX